MFFCANVQRHSRLLEHDIGDCQFCSGTTTVDLIEQRSKWYLFGIIPTKEGVEQVALCRQCGRAVKEAYYTLRIPKSDKVDVPTAEELVEVEGQII